MSANQSPVAVIDLGTNTFHLLIAAKKPDKGFETLHRETFVARIGQGGISQGMLTDEAYQRTIGALEGFRQQTDKFGVTPDRIFATATSAIRSAHNGSQLVEEILHKTGIQIQIITGDKEAEYIYYGVQAALYIGEPTSLIMDIGGGSVEFILCNANQIYWKQSFEIGAQRLLDQFMQTDPISPQAIGRLNTYLDEKLIPLTNAIHQYQPEVLIGASGTFETLCAMQAEQEGQTIDLEELIEGELKFERFQTILQQLLQNDRAGRLALPGMLAMRVDMIVVASCLLNFVLQKYSLPRIRVSGYALKEGVLATLDID
jgi:exopolyphosphatase/guanosine-5'-triphosphate,3'-diphosphate pyrophosphatase